MVRSSAASTGLATCIWKPATTEEQPERRHPRSGDSLPPDAVPSFDLSGLNVLVVDDEPDARVLIARLLTGRNATVRTAGSADEAFAMLQSEKPDILISDIGMPDEDGYSLIRRVRALDAAHAGNVPALALTAYARAEDRMKALLGFRRGAERCRPGGRGEPDAFDDWIRDDDWQDNDDSDDSVDEPAARQPMRTVRVESLSALP